MVHAPGVRLMRMTQHAALHDLEDWTLDVQLRGDPADDSVEGEDTPFPTPDTLKRTVYLLAGQSTARGMEEFAEELIEALLGHYPQVTGVDVSLQSHLWKRLMVEGQPSPTAFMKGSDERQTTWASRVREGQLRLRSGFLGMTLLRAAQPALGGSNEGVLTTSPETTEVVSVTTMTAEWNFTPAAVADGAEYSKVRHHLRERMISTFARGTSTSVQQTSQAMAEAALGATDVIDEVFLRSSNSQPLRADSGRSEAANHHIFVPTDEAHETVEARVRRG